MARRLLKATGHCPGGSQTLKLSAELLQPLVLLDTPGHTPGAMHNVCVLIKHCVQRPQDRHYKCNTLEPASQQNLQIKISSPAECKCSPGAHDPPSEMMARSSCESCQFSQSQTSMTWRREGCDKGTSLPGERSLVGEGATDQESGGWVLGRSPRISSLILGKPLNFFGPHSFGPN